MRITANQVTLARLFLLPVPVAMIYRNTHAMMLGALFVYILLGLTDALDGYLARKHGSTPLGALLDPVVDKIFLVAGYVPLADFQIFPTTLVAILFIREVAVTALRSIALEEGFAFTTSTIAKLKTTVQMAGAGFILLIWLFPDDRKILTILGIATAAAAVPAIVALARGRKPSWMAWSAIAWIGAILVIRLLLPLPAAMLVILFVIVALTVYTGLEYAWGMRHVLAARFRRAPLEAARLAGLSLAVPVFYLPALDRPDDPTVSILGLLAAELAIGGVDNSLAQAGHVRGPLPDLARSGTQAVCGAVLLWALFSGGGGDIALGATLIALATTLAELSVRLWRHRTELLSPGLTS